MMEIKAFGCMVLVVASVMLFSLASVPGVASAYTPTSEVIEVIDFIKDQDEKMVDGFEDVANYDPKSHNLFTLEEVIILNKGYTGGRLILIDQ